MTDTDLDALVRERDALQAEKLELVEQHAPAWLARLEAHGTGVDRGAYITEFDPGIEGVAYILRAYTESHARQKQEIRALRTTLEQRTAALRKLCDTAEGCENCYLVARAALAGVGEE